MDSFLRFTLVGCLLFVVSLFTGNDRSSQPEILVSKNLKNQFVGQFKSSHGRTPRPEELAKLIDEYVQDEALVRQAIEWSLHHSDPIVRRRLVQKVQFMFAGYQGEGKIRPSDIEAFYDDNHENYRKEGEISFKQVFVSLDKHGDQSERHAKDLLKILNSGQAAKSDNWYLGSPEFIQKESSIDRLFGSGFSDRVNSATEGVWSGPYPSSFGYHLVKITQKKDAFVPEFNEVKDQVWIDYRKAREREAFRKFVSETVAKYNVVEGESPRAN